MARRQLDKADVNEAFSHAVIKVMEERAHLIHLPQQGEEGHRNLGQARQGRRQVQHSGDRDTKAVPSPGGAVMP